MIVGGLGLAVLWNVAGALELTPSGQGWGLMLPLPGLLLWLVALALPRLWSGAAGTPLKSYRLVYDAPEGWSDAKARLALANLAATLGPDFGLVWGREPEGSGCWLCIPQSYEIVLRRLVADMFPTGQVEADSLPPVGDGVVLLACRQDLAPAHELCRMDGVAGVYYRRRGGGAVVALWGAQAVQVAEQFARKQDLLVAPAQTLLRPRFVGDDPWPELPVFPPSQNNPGLTSVARLERTAPGLRVNGRRALVLGLDGEGHQTGFAGPALDGMQSVAIWGQRAEDVVVNLVEQAVRAGMPVLFLDGRGAVAAQLGRRLFREVATERVLVCETERPARSHFRLNPLWLPDTAGAWPVILNTVWMAWLRELGVTSAGLGKDAFRHSRVAVVLTALAAAQQSLALDVAGLRDALESPDFLALLDRDALAHAEVLDEAMWQWWLDEGRQTPKFDLRLRLGHLRDRLNMLLALPEYEMLWQPPYFDPPAAAQGQCLFWRFGHMQARLQPYISSQLAAIATLLHVWPRQAGPVLVFAHELPLGRWANLLRSSAALRLVVSGQRMHTAPDGTQTLLLSRLHQEDAQKLQAHLASDIRAADIRAADLRRLAEARLLVRRGDELGTVEIDS